MERSKGAGSRATRNARSRAMTLGSLDDQQVPDVLVCDAGSRDGEAAQGSRDGEKHKCHRKKLCTV